MPGWLPLSLGAVELLTGEQCQQGELITVTHLARYPTFLAFFCLLIPLKYLAVSRSVLSMSSSTSLFFPYVLTWKLNLEPSNYKYVLYPRNSSQDVFFPTFFKV